MDDTENRAADRDILDSEMVVTDFAKIDPSSNLGVYNEGETIATENEVEEFGALSTAAPPNKNLNTFVQNLEANGVPNPPDIETQGVPNLAVAEGDNMVDGNLQLSNLQPLASSSASDNFKDWKSATKKPSEFLNGCLEGSQSSEPASSAQKPLALSTESDSAEIPINSNKDSFESADNGNSNERGVSAKRPKPSDSLLSQKKIRVQEIIKRQGKSPVLHPISLVLGFCNLESLRRLSMVSKTFKKIVVAHKYWKCKAMSLEKDLCGHVGSVNVLFKVSSFVFSGSNDGKIKIWDIHTWKCERTVNLNLYPTPDQQHNAEGSTAISSKPPTSQSKARKTSARIQSAQNGSSGISTYGGNDSADGKDSHARVECDQMNSVTCLAVLDKVLFIGLEDGNLMVRMILDSKEAKSENRCIKAHNGCIKAIAVSSRLQKVFTSGADRRINIYDARTYSLSAFLNRHMEVVNCLQVCDDRLFSGDRNGKVYVWSLHTDSYETTLEKGEKEKFGNKSMGSITSIISYDGKVYVASWDCYIRIYNAKKLNMLNAVFLWPVGVCWSMVVRIVKDQPPCLVIGVREGDVEIREITPNNTLPVLSSLEADSWCPIPLRHQQAVTCVLPLPDGRIVTGATDWSLKVWNYRFAPPIVPPPREPYGNVHGAGRQNYTGSAHEPRTGPVPPMQRPPSTGASQAAMNPRVSAQRMPTHELYPSHGYQAPPNPPQVGFPVRGASGFSPTAYHQSGVLDPSSATNFSGVRSYRRPESGGPVYPQHGYPVAGQPRPPSGYGAPSGTAQHVYAPTRMSSPYHSFHERQATGATPHSQVRHSSLSAPQYPSQPQPNQPGRPLGEEGIGSSGQQGRAAASHGNGHSVQHQPNPPSEESMPHQSHGSMPGYSQPPQPYMR